MDEKFLPEWSNYNRAMGYLGLSDETDKDILLSLVSEKRIKSQILWGEWTLATNSRLLLPTKTLGWNNPPILPTVSKRDAIMELYRPPIKGVCKNRFLTIDEAEIAHEYDRSGHLLRVKTVVENGKSSYLACLRKAEHSKKEFHYYIDFPVVSIEELRFERKSLIDFKNTNNTTNEDKQQKPLPPYLDPNSPLFCKELEVMLQAAEDIHVKGWRPDKGFNNHEELVQAWLDTHFPDEDISTAFYERLHPAINPKPRLRKATKPKKGK